MNRRTFFASVALLALARRARAQGFDITLTEAEWRARLTPEQYAVLRGQDTEPAGSSPLERETRSGIFACAGCALPLFSSAQKYDSGTGWPSFRQALPGAVGTRPDPGRFGGLFGSRTEVHCRRCGGHLGHVFEDGPAPTGKRWCMNGVAMVFIAT